MCIICHQHIVIMPLLDIDVWEDESYSYKFYKFILAPCVKRGPNISN